MFFCQEREHFFRPLGGKYREVMVACIRALYLRLYSPDADYTYHLSREEIRDLFVEILRETPVLSVDTDELPLSINDAADDQTKANSILRLLTECGWLERYMDKGAMTTAFRFTKAGKAFAETLENFQRKGLKTRQRNVRNTKNALESFLNDKDPYDLIDAVDYAQQVVSDLSDDIADLHERKRLLMKIAVEKVAVAVEEFLEFMDKHFVPDLAIRLSADSVERHRHRIRDIVEQIQNWPAQDLMEIDKRLRQLIPDAKSYRDKSVVLFLLEQIHHYVESACLAKTPELRAALDSFVNRANLIIKQATALSVGLGASPVANSLSYLAELKPAKQDELLLAAGELMGPISVQLIDPNAIKLRQVTFKKEIEETHEVQEPSREEKLMAAIADAEENAFSVSMDEVRSQISKQMGQNDELRCSDFVINGADSLLALSHAVEIASVGNAEGEEEAFTIEPTGKRYSTPYMEGEEYIIRKQHDE